MQRLESDEMLDFVKASLGYHEIRVRRDEGIVFIQSYCLIIPVLVISFDLNIFLKHTCTSGCCSLHCSFGFVCILGRFRYWKVNGMCVCVHVCVAHLSVIHICSHMLTHEFTHIHAHIHTWHNTAFTKHRSIRCIVQRRTYKHISSACANLYMQTFSQKGVAKACGIL